MRAVAIVVLLVAGCATTAPDVVTFDRCNTGRVIDGCDVSDLPPLLAMLPPWPFPALRDEPAAPPPPAPESDTPASRLLRRLTK